MTEFLAWFSPSVMHLLATALLHFVWQGLLLAGVLAILMTAVRDASTRYAFAVSVLFFVVASPVATFLVLRQSATSNHGVATVQRTSAHVPTSDSPVTGELSLKAEDGSVSPETFLWLGGG